MTQSGVLPASALSAAIAADEVRLGAPLGERQLQPASLDLTLGKKAWRIRASFLPGAGVNVADRLSAGLTMHELDLTGSGAVLEKGCVYLVPLRESLALPADISGMANPKSSTGRIDVFVRMVTDGATAFERAPAGYHGPLYAEISPKTFSILVREGSSLNQLRLRRGRALCSDQALRNIHQQSPLISDSGRIDQGLCMTVQVAGKENEIIGYRARRHSGLIDVDEVGALDPGQYWEPITAPKSGFIILDPDEFYILASKESLRIPPDMAAEMLPIDPLLGEFRVHYAGFFDPGFGCKQAGGQGSRAVLEVRGHDAPFILEDGQMVARLAYEHLSETPETLYGQGLQSNYQGQGLKLSKHFKPWA